MIEDMGKLIFFIQIIAAGTSRRRATASRGAERAKLQPPQIVANIR